MARADIERLQSIKTFPSLVKYLRDELDWPIESMEIEDDLYFDFAPEELGIAPKTAANIQEIKQLRPLDGKQPWGIFFVKFEPKRLPVVVLRKILNQLVIKKRAAAGKAMQAAWHQQDLLFISSYGEQEQRHITFAHFTQDPAGKDLPTLKVLGWDAQDTVLHVEAVVQKLKANFRWPRGTFNPDQVREQWSAAFTYRHREVITTSKELAQRLAELARSIRHQVLEVIQYETDKGPIRQLFNAFRTALIHDLEPEGFADMYAQTIAYGLLSARIADPTKTTLDDFAAHMRTNPFLRELMETFLRIGGRKGKAGGPGIDFDELGVSEVVALLDEADMEAVVRDFGDRNPTEDPVIHFYEHFLAAYDKQLKVSRGVFYTPRPVVSYIVRSVHELLQTEFGLEDGLADTTTWGEMLKKHPGLKLPPLTDEPGEKRTISPDEPFVQILDPATGTATFLVEAIEVIHQTLQAKWKKQRITEPQQLAAWNEYVPKHLLPRLHGYELMMAPYAIAHMKIGLKLAETGYRFGTEERARIFLTNALEPWAKQPMLVGFGALAHEAAEVNEIKRNKRYTVVIGNPPYSGISWNMTDASQRLVERYRFVGGVPLGERKLWLQNDYVKFLGFAHKLILDSGFGCLGYITDNSYLDGPTFRGVRSNLLQDFSSLQVLNLHGSAKKKNRPSGVEVDQNVFDITQGVAVIHGVRTPTQGQHRFRLKDVIGTRQAKYKRLSPLVVTDPGWSELTPAHPFYLFVETTQNGEAEFNAYYSVKAAFPLQSVGIQTSRDDLAIDFTRQELVAKIRDFASPKASDAEIRERYFPGKKNGKYLPGDTRGWSLSLARKELQKVKNLETEIVGIHYRPFDFRFLYYSHLLVDWPRPEVSEQMISGENLALCLLRRTENAREYDYFSVSRATISNHQVSLKDGTYLVPLYVESLGVRNGLFGHEHDKRPNLSSDFIEAVTRALKLSQKGVFGLPVGLTPEDIFYYAFAVFYSPNYRCRYAEFLKIDYPRLPLTGSLELFHALAKLGGELTALHLMESSKLTQAITDFIGSRNPEIEKVSWSENTVWIDKAKTTGFKGVREDVWNFSIGGYQVCEKWLKDRKGRVLSAEDITHYQKIVVALSETIRLMTEIDEVIGAHGGWSGAFVTGD